MFVTCRLVIVLLLDDVKHASSPEVWRVLHLGPRVRAIDRPRQWEAFRNLYNPPYKQNNVCALWRRCKVINTAHTSAQRLTSAQVFEQLKKPIDPKVTEQRERELNERAHQQYERAQQRQAEIVSRGGMVNTMDTF